MWLRNIVFDAGDCLERGGESIHSTHINDHLLDTQYNEQ